VRIRRAAFLAAIGACGLAAACIPDLITDPLPDATPAPQIGAFCGDGIITLGQYDGGFADLAAGEACDPSEAGTLGCTHNCQIDCDGGLLDPNTNHCYFSVQSATSLGEGESSADALCQKQNAHAVTFVDDNERDLVVSHFNKKLDASAFWVNLTLLSDQGGYVPNPRKSEIVYEPGWSSTCPGCYAPPNVTPDAGIPMLVPDAGGNCVIDVGARLGWSAFPCTQIPTPVPVICEREPPGELWSPCNGGYCASVPQTAGKKRYLYSPNPATSDVASAACIGLAGSLVIFESVEERETLLRELLREFDVQQVESPPTDAWIGLSFPGDAGPSFAWDNGTPIMESPWGDNQPVDAAPPLRAYVLLASGTYDVQLAHDDIQVARPYICQLPAN
jgi:hypothetical protein